MLSSFLSLLTLRCLDGLPDNELVHYLPQLVQVLKFENYHFGPLAMFLLRRALLNRLVVGHALFWYMMTEIGNFVQLRARYALLIEAYIVGCGEQRGTYSLLHVS